MGNINHVKYNIGDRVLFDYNHKSFTDKQGIWSAIIKEVKDTYREFNRYDYTIEFDGVIHPDGIIKAGPQDSYIMQIHFPNDLRPRIYNHMVDDLKTSKWKEQVETQERFEREKEISIISAKRATFIVGQNISYKKYDITWNALPEYQDGIIISIDNQSPILTVRNNNGTEDQVMFNNVIDL